MSAGLGGLWVVGKLIVGTYMKQREKIVQLEKDQIFTSIRELKEITADHGKDLRVSMGRLHEFEKSMITLSDRIAHFEFKNKKSELAT